MFVYWSNSSSSLLLFYCILDRWLMIGWRKFLKHWKGDLYFHAYVLLCMSVCAQGREHTLRHLDFVSHSLLWIHQSSSCFTNNNSNSEDMPCVLSVRRLDLNETREPAKTKYIWTDTLHKFLASLLHSLKPASYNKQKTPIEHIPWLFKVCFFSNVTKFFCHLLFSVKIKFRS